MLCDMVCKFSVTFLHNIKYKINTFFFLLGLFLIKQYIDDLLSKFKFIENPSVLEPQLALAVLFHFVLNAAWALLKVAAFSSLENSSRLCLLYLIFILLFSFGYSVLIWMLLWLSLGP